MTAAATQKHPHPIDLRFQQFGLWYVLGKAPGQQQLSMWLCQCACGTQAALHADALLEGRARSCGCDYVDARGHRQNFRDLTGQALAGYLVLARAWQKVGRSTLWNCVCLGCGAGKTVEGPSLTSGKRQRGCKACAEKKKSPVQIGGRYGDLIVKRSAGVKRDIEKPSQVFLCLCCCGREVEVRGDCLRKGDTTSCGCKRTRKAEERLQSRYGWWEVIGPRQQSYKDEAGKTVRAKVVCRCRGCGQERWVDVGRLLRGGSNSCIACKRRYRQETTADLSAWAAIIDAQQQREEACA